MEGQVQEHPGGSQVGSCRTRMLSKTKMAVEMEWLESLMIGLFLTMVVLCGYLLRNEKWHEYETWRTTWGKWRISDEKGGE
jgi:hypothetical protein